MMYIVCGGRDRRLGPLDLAILAAIHRPDAHPLLRGIRRRLEALEPAWPWAMLGDKAGIYHGDAPGSDTDAGAFAHLLGIHVEPFPYLGQHGRAGGPIRNGHLLVGRRGEKRLEKPLGVLAFRGGSGTADMVAQARAAGVPVLDIAAHPVALAPFQRWTKDDAWLIRSDRRRCLEVQTTRPGLGPPIVSGHWLKVRGEVVLQPWCLYVGRTAHGLRGHPRLANPFPVKPLGDGTVVVQTQQGSQRCTPEEALVPYRAHLTSLIGRSIVVADELLAIARQRRILVCWCGDSKPCHACIIAEFAVNYLALEACRAACPST